MSNKNADFLDSPTRPKPPVVKLTAFERFCRQICPCFARKREKAYREDSSHLNKNVAISESSELQDLPKGMIDDVKTRRKPKNLFRSAIHNAPVRDDVGEYLEKRRTVQAIS